MSNLSLYGESCPNCGSNRDKNKKKSCPFCGSQSYPFLGYTYPHEWSSFRLVLIVLGIVLLILLSLAVVYLYRVVVVLNVFP